MLAFLFLSHSDRCFTLVKNQFISSPEPGNYLTKLPSYKRPIPDQFVMLNLFQHLLAGKTLK
jgi:hypothetical protein